jgi:hypothetical protein
MQSEQTKQSPQKAMSSHVVLWMRIQNLQTLAAIYRERGDEAEAKAAEELAVDLLRAFRMGVQ